MKPFGLPALVTFSLDLDEEQLYGTLRQPDGMSACTWAANDDYLSLFPAALEPDQASYWFRRLEDGMDPLTVGAVREIAYGLAEEIYGVPWWAAHRLCASALVNWFGYQVWCVTSGFDPVRESPCRIVASIWAWRCSALDARDEHAAARLEREIFTPPADAGASVVVEERRLAENRAVFAGLGGLIPG